MWPWLSAGRLARAGLPPRPLPLARALEGPAQRSRERGGARGSGAGEGATGAPPPPGIPPRALAARPGAPGAPAGPSGACQVRVEHTSRGDLARAPPPCSGTPSSTGWWIPEAGPPPLPGDRRPLAGMALGFLVKRSRDAWGEQRNRQCRAVGVRRPRCFLCGVGEEPCYESWKDETAEQIIQD